MKIGRVQDTKGTRVLLNNWKAVFTEDNYQIQGTGVNKT